MLDIELSDIIVKISNIYGPNNDEFGFCDFISGLLSKN